MEYLLLLLGLALLIFSGRILINNAVAIAARFNLSPLVIGLTIVAIGTSAPEFLVSLSGAIKGHPDIAIYNVVGSNISNIMLVLAVAALILPIPVGRVTIRKDWPYMMLLSLVFTVFLLDLKLDKFEGAILLVLLTGFVGFSIVRSRNDSGDDVQPEVRPRPLLPALVLVVVSSGGLAFGADMLVDNAVNLARSFGVSERVISVSLIAVGTSIPELTTSAIAAFRKETEISVGNIIGSNIFNIGFVLGCTSLVRTLEINPLILSFDIYWLLGAAVFLMLLVFLPPVKNIGRWKGLSLLSGYLIYLYFVIGHSHA